MTWSPGLVIRRLPGWADSASDTIVTVRRRLWGQIRRFRRRVPLLHSAPERFDHGEQHSQDRRAGTVTAHACVQQVSAAFAALPGSRVLTWDGAQRMVTAFAGFRRLTASAPQPKCDLGYVQ
jgi:hypothetical protein